MKKILCAVLAVLLLAGCTSAPEEQSPATTAGDGKLRAQIAGEQTVFEPWEGSGVPTEGTYFLKNNVELTEPVVVTGDLKLHLGGQTVTAASGVLIKNLFVIPAGTSMTLYDDEGSAGAVVSPRSYGADPAVTSMFLVGGSLTVAGGHINASAISLENVANGLGVYVQTGGDLEITGGTITGGTTWRTEENPEDGVYMGDGGSVYVDKGGVCTLSGGVVQEGSAGRGGNFFVADDPENPGQLIIAGGSVYSGESLYTGGNIYVAGHVQMSGGVIEAGEAYGNGGNLFVSGRLEITGGELLDGVCDINTKLNRRGGNICVNGLNAYVSIRNCSLIGGQASGKENYGGNISITGQGAAFFEMSDCLLSEGLGHRGGNFYIGHLADDISAENMDYVISNTVFEYGSTTYRGANICVDTKNKERPILLTLNNCELTLKDNDQHDNIAVGAGGTDVSQCHVVMNGGSISNGVLTIYGSSSLTLNGVTSTEDTHGAGGELIINP